VRTTYRQPPNMRGKKTYVFGCGCCWARNCREEELGRVAWREVKQELIFPTDLGGGMEYVMIGDVEYEDGYAGDC
jgi:hypothetical protein